MYYILELNNLIIISIKKGNRRNIKESKLSDSEIISISIVVGEILIIDSENVFFSLLIKIFFFELKLLYLENLY